MRKIVGVAMRVFGQVIEVNRHKAQMKNAEEGFIDSDGNFLNRIEAFEVARKAGQFGDIRIKRYPLTSEFLERYEIKGEKSGNARPLWSR